MQAQISIFILLCVSSGTFSKPYEYSYYVASPGHYQTLAVRDGQIINTGQPSLTPQSNVNRHGRTYPGFNPSASGRGQNPEIGRRYPTGPNPNGYDFGGGLNPENAQAGRRYPTGPNPGGYDFGGGLNPDGRRYPGGYNFGAGQNYPVSEPNGELDPLFGDGRISHGQNGRYPYQGRGFNEIDRGFNQFGGFPNYRQSGYEQGPLQYDFRTQQPGYFSHSNIKRKAPGTQEIDESTTATNMETTTLLIDGDKEEVTAKPECAFCGVEKVNPRDEIVGENNPDSEPVEPKNVNIGNNFLIPSGVAPPANVVPAPVIPYYVVV